MGTLSFAILFGSVLGFFVALTHKLYWSKVIAGDSERAWNIKFGMTIVGGVLILLPAVLLEDWLESSFIGGWEHLVVLVLSFLLVSLSSLTLFGAWSSYGSTADEVSIVTEFIAQLPQLVRESDEVQEALVSLEYGRKGRARECVKKAKERFPECRQLDQLIVEIEKDK